MSDSDIFAAVSAPTRRRILTDLAEGECTAGELGEPHDISQPAMAKHLRRLREANLVSTRRQGRNTYYRLEPERLRTIAEWLSHFERFWEERLDALGEYLDELEEEDDETNSGS